MRRLSGRATIVPTLAQPTGPTVATVKNYFAHGSFPQVGQKQKTEKKEREKKERKTEQW